jgi:hypothetical protein
MAPRKTGQTASQAAQPLKSSTTPALSKHQQADLSSSEEDEVTDSLQQNIPTSNLFSDLPQASQPLRGKSAPEIAQGIPELTVRDFLALPPPCNSFQHSDLQTQALQARMNPATKDYMLYVKGRTALQTFYKAKANHDKLQDFLDKHRIPRSFQLNPLQGLFKAKLETTLRLTALKNQYEEATLATVANHHRQTAQEAAVDFEAAWTVGSEYQNANYIKLKWTVVYKQSLEHAAKRAAERNSSNPENNSDPARTQNNTTTTPHRPPPRANTRQPRNKLSRSQQIRDRSPAPGRSTDSN